MQFFKNILGFGNDLGQRIDKFKARGSLFEVVKDTRNIKYLSLYTDLKNAQSHLARARLKAHTQSTSGETTNNAANCLYTSTWMQLLSLSIKAANLVRVLSGNSNRRHSMWVATCRSRADSNSGISSVSSSRTWPKMSILRTTTLFVKNWRECQFTRQKSKQTLM